MKLENHKKKIEKFEKTIKKLSLDEDSEILIEAYMLASSHYINAAMHKLRTLKEDRDIKHNNIFGFLKREGSLQKDSEEIAYLIQEIEQLRPSYVYGRGDDSNAAKKAKEAYEKIKYICKKVIEDERKSENSNRIR